MKKESVNSRRTINKEFQQWQTAAGRESSLQIWTQEFVLVTECLLKHQNYDNQLAILYLKTFQRAITSYFLYLSLFKLFTYVVEVLAFAEPHKTHNSTFGKLWNKNTRKIWRLVFSYKEDNNSKGTKREQELLIHCNAPRFIMREAVVDSDMGKYFNFEQFVSTYLYTKRKSVWDTRNLSQVQTLHFPSQNI